MSFCNAFDEHLSQHGPAAVFLPDHEGLYRFDASWTRDAWERNPGPHAIEPVWVLFRDHASGYITCVHCSSPTLLVDHPRGDVRIFPTQDEAHAARDAYGRPPLCETPWS